MVKDATRARISSSLRSHFEATEQMRSEWVVLKRQLNRAGVATPLAAPSWPPDTWSTFLAEQRQRLPKR